VQKDARCIFAAAFYFRDWNAKVSANESAPALWSRKLNCTREWFCFLCFCSLSFSYTRSHLTHSRAAAVFASVHTESVAYLVIFHERRHTQTWKFKRRAECMCLSRMCMRAHLSFCPPTATRRRRWHANWLISSCSTSSLLALLFGKNNFACSFVTYFSGVIILHCMLVCALCVCAFRFRCDALKQLQTRTAPAERLRALWWPLIVGMGRGCRY